MSTKKPRKPAKSVPVYVKTPDGEVKKTAVTVKVTLDGKVFKSNEKKFNSQGQHPAPAEIPKPDRVMDPSSGQ
jgi:hypothetical protein